MEKKDPPAKRERVIQLAIVLTALGMLLLLYADFCLQQPVNITVISADGTADASSSTKQPAKETTVSETLKSPNPSSGVSALYQEESAVSSGVSSSSTTAGQEEQDVLMEKSIDLNTATEEELDRLPGIGPVLAKRIVSYREENGDFLVVEELLDVKGIGEKTFERIQDYLVAN